MKIDFTKVTNIEMEDVEGCDYPDFSNAYISACDYNGHEATEEELKAINEQCDFIDQLALGSLC